MLATVAAMELRDYGAHCLHCIDNALCVIPTFGLPECDIFPECRHEAVSKTSGKTNGIERFNCTLRQRVSRLVRETLSFSKKLENHIGAIWYFIHHYNELLRL